VLDFGLAKVTERQMRPGSVILTQEGMVFGTPEFMSPEQAQGKTLTPASDIYSLAVILYEVLTGKLPFEAKSAMDYIQLHVMAKAHPLNQRVPGRTFPPSARADHRPRAREASGRALFERGGVCGSSPVGARRRRCGFQACRG
jgi:serine/threonine protein kinase